MQKAAIENNIPIITDDAWEYLNKCLTEQKPKKILEIGTAIGYSSSKIALTVDDNAHIISVELDKERYSQAANNIASLGLEHKITLINDDAAAVIAEYERQNIQFDFIFLDGPKGQYLNYLPTLKKILKCGGVLFCDNITFHGYSKNYLTVRKKMRTIATNLFKFEQAIRADSELSTQIIPCGDDAIAICKKVC